jgi:tripartite-type tricarboxylate transporter receptor subunit TctC
MKHLTRRTVLASALTAPAVVRADDFPSHTIRLVIPWPPGASADAFLRAIADQTGRRLARRWCRTTSRAPTAR